MTSIYDLKELIEKSINRERLSHRLYLEWSEKVAEDDAKKVLLSLAADEKTHQETLERMMRDGKIDEFANPSAMGANAPVIKVPEVDELTAESTAKEFISFAIHHEALAVQYYSRYMDVFRDTELFPFFERMRDEERGHKNKLERVFLKNYAGKRNSH